jgi:hypothetical protein
MVGREIVEMAKCWGRRRGPYSGSRSAHCNFGALHSEIIKKFLYGTKYAAAKHSNLHLCIQVSHLRFFGLIALLFMDIFL